MTIKEEILQKTNAAIIYRTNLLMKAANNPTLQAIEMESCKRDILYFFENYLYTDRNDSLYGSEYPDALPFLLYDFQKEMVTEIRESISEGAKPVSDRDINILLDIFIEKSRQMGASWVIMGVYVYGYIFHNHKYHCISQKEKDVDEIGNIRSLLQKARFMLNNMPGWMLPPGYTKSTGGAHNKTLNISRADGTGSITGEAAHPNASRSGTYNSIFEDEQAFQDYAVTINAAASSATPCRIMTSTPNGMGNEFYRMKLRTRKRKGPDGEILPADIKGLRYHWRDHPLYTQERYNQRIKGMSKESIAQELEIDYNTAIVGRVYAEFPTEPSNIEYDITKPMYLWMDNNHGGTDPNAIIVMQPNGVYRDIIDCVQIRQTPELCAAFLACNPQFVLNRLEEEFLERYKNYNWQRATRVTDLYDVDSAMGSSTIRKDYRKSKLELVTPKERRKEIQIRNTRTNIYRVRRNERCLEFANAIMNSKYPERKETSQSTQENKLPVHDQFSHYRTALEYGANYLLENELPNKPRVPEDNRVQKDGYGQMVYPKSMFKPQPVNLQFNNL